MNKADPMIMRYETEPAEVMPMPSIWSIAETSYAISIECHEMTNRIRTLLNGNADTPVPPMRRNDNEEMNVKAILLTQNDILGSLGKMLKDILAETQR